MERKGPVIVLCLIVVGLIVASLSELLMPLGYGVALLWLGVAVIANGGIWFGGWGVLAGVLFPFLSAQFQGFSLEDSLSEILPNLVDGLIPAFAFRHLGTDPALQDRRGVSAYMIWVVVVPSLLSGALVGGSWILIGKADWGAIRLLALDWSLSNMVVLTVLGFPALYLLTPVFRRRGWLVEGWWR